MWQIIPGIVGGFLTKVAGKLIDYIPGREESLRNNLQKLERERDQIMSLPDSTRSYVRLQRVLDEIRTIESKLQNR